MVTTAPFYGTRFVALPQPMLGVTKDFAPLFQKAAAFLALRNLPQNVANLVEFAGLCGDFQRA